MHKIGLHEHICITSLCNFCWMNQPQVHSGTLNGKIRIKGKHLVLNSISWKLIIVYDNSKSLLHGVTVNILQEIWLAIKDNRSSVKTQLNSKWYKLFAATLLTVQSWLYVNKELSLDFLQGNKQTITQSSSIRKVTKNTK